MYYEYRVEQQIHYASLEEVKKNHDKQFTIVTTQKNVQTITIKNVHICNYTLEFAIYIKNMELLKLYSKNLF